MRLPLVEDDPSKILIGPELDDERLVIHTRQDKDNLQRLSGKQNQRRMCDCSS